MNARRHFLPEDLLAEARAATEGLQDFGDDSFREGLDRLCSALDAEAQLSDMGRTIMRQKLVTQLANRLRIEQHFRQHPEIAGEQIAPGHRRPAAHRHHQAAPPAGAREPLLVDEFLGVAVPGAVPQ
jgi:hypothetical protein